MLQSILARGDCGGGDGSTLSTVIVLETLTSRLLMVKHLQIYKMLTELSVQDLHFM